mmetsp:Transcript_66727/g.204128  ORF Transcript_66727/g.204128 Transcript_66727/m.204128 type:complete len:200 (-) Transcript_66727:550-1149(-)
MVDCTSERTSPPVHKSITKWSVSWSKNAAWSSTMYGCFNFRAMVSSVWFSFAQCPLTCSFGVVFRAKIAPSSMRLTLNTVPKEPLPSSASMLYELLKIVDDGGTAESLRSPLYGSMYSGRSGKTENETVGDRHTTRESMPHTNCSEQTLILTLCGSALSLREKSERPEMRLLKAEHCTATSPEPNDPFLLKATSSRDAV